MAVGKLYPLYGPEGVRPGHFQGPNPLLEPDSEGFLAQQLAQGVSGNDGGGGHALWQEQLEMRAEVIKAEGTPGQKKTKEP